MLQKYQPDTLHIISYEPLPLRQNFTYEEVPILVLDHQEKVLQSKKIPLVKILWQ